MPKHTKVTVYHAPQFIVEGHCRVQKELVIACDTQETLQGALDSASDMKLDAHIGMVNIYRLIDSSVPFIETKRQPTKKSR